MNELEDLQNRARSIFARPEGGRGMFGIAGSDVDWTPAVDVAEDDKEFTITADLPDVPKENVKVSIENDTLTIQGERTHEEEEHKKKYHRIERSFGKYVRNFQIPRDVEVGGIEAKFEGGVLKVRLPKKETAPENKQEIPVT
jgi:HSP20 family protein